VRLECEPDDPGGSSSSTESPPLIPGMFLAPRPIALSLSFFTKILKLCATLSDEKILADGEDTKRAMRTPRATMLHYL